MYTLDGNDWDDYYANKLGVATKWQVTVYDLPEGHEMSFFIRIVEKDGRIRLANNEGKNYTITLKASQKTGAYRAQVRVSKLAEIGHICLLCGTSFAKKLNHCPNPGCGATYCPQCSRMLPPKANYCPWCKQDF